MNSHSGQRRPIAEPAKQKRSVKKRDSLIAVARAEIERQPWEALSVETLARLAGCSVGTFYQRFANKDALLLVLIEEMLEQARGASREIYSNPLQELPIEQLVSQAVTNFRRNAGLLRTAARKGTESDMFWAPIRRFGQENCEALIGCLRRLGRVSTDDQETRIRFAHQMMIGVLVNTLLNVPGRLTIDTKEFQDELVRAVSILIERGCRQ